MKVGELRKALEGVPDDLEVAAMDETWWYGVDRAEVGYLVKVHDRDLGLGDETSKERGRPYFLIT